LVIGWWFLVGGFWLVVFGFWVVLAAQLCCHCEAAGRGNPSSSTQPPSFVTHKKAPAPFLVRGLFTFVGLSLREKGLTPLDARNGSASQ
jgi:hypothetical protein